MYIVGILEKAIDEAYAAKLIGKSLSEAVELPKGIVNASNRGDLGSLVEKYFFEHTPPNNHDPDFKEAGLELKTTGVVTKNGQYGVLVEKSIQRDGNCGFNKMVSSVFYMKTWKCPDFNPYFNLTSNLCQDTCGLYYF